MKYIKEYEGIVNFNEINIGEFVQIKTNNKFYGFFEPEKIKELVNTSIGKIIDKKNYREIVVKYENLRSILIFDINEITEIGKTKEELELKLNMKKYNL